MLKYAAFGASVTQQENGYVDKLSNLINTKIKKFGYGGMHLSDAGVCFIDKVLKYKPDCVFIDWFSTNYMEQSVRTEQLIDTIIYKFSNINCKLVFLLFPELRSDDKQEEKNNFYIFLRKQFQKRNAYYIDLADKFSHDELKECLRDDVHTTEYGAKRYAEAIFQYLTEKEQYLLNKDLFIQNAYYKDIHCLPIDRVFSKSIELSMDCEIIGLYNTIGRNSGLCNIVFDDGTSIQKSIWDRWCHYERKHFCLSIPSYKGNVSIKILQDSFDTSLCNVNVIFSKYKKNITCHAIYWIGNDLHLYNKNDGSFIKILYIQLIRILKKIKHTIGKLFK